MTADAPLPATPSFTQRQLDWLRDFLQPKDLRTSAAEMSRAMGRGGAGLLQQFVGQGLIAPAPLEDVAGRRLSASDLRLLAARHGIKTTGTKAEIIVRLHAAKPEALEDAVAGHQLYRCTEAGRALLDRQAEARSHAEAEVSLRVRALLRSGDGSAALEFIQEFDEQWGDVERRLDADSITRILKATPESLAELGDKIHEVRASAAMMEIFEDWEPDEDVDDTWLRQVNHVLAWARIQGDADEQLTAAVQGYTSLEDRIGFVVDVAHGGQGCARRCRKLDGQEFTRAQLPHFPLAGCTSLSGCDVQLDSVYNEDPELSELEEEEDEEAEEQAQDGIEEEDGEAESDSSEDRIRRLRELKQWFDERLITDEEFAAKKAEILSEL